MSDTKPTILLATALFLVSAPEPDSATIAELTANFIVPTNERALLASDLEAQDIITTDPVAPTRQQHPRPVHESAESGSSDDSIGPG